MREGRRETLTSDRGDELRVFVRETLGCGCPEEVLAHIEVREGSAAAGVEGVAAALEVGGRLLVWILVGGKGAGEPGSFGALVRAGRCQRDARGFNRLRLVLPKPAQAEPGEKALSAIVAEAGDERVHLHLLDPGDLPRLTDPG